MLNKNISLNNLTDKITAYNIAINDVNELSVLNLKDDITPGRSGNTFKDELNQEYEIFSPLYKQGVLGVPLDEIVSKYDIDFPNHIKIDVDGNEYKIIHGMENVLRDNRLKTITIEINTRYDQDKDLSEIIQNTGFKRIMTYKNEMYEKSGIINYFFIRNAA